MGYKNTFKQSLILVFFAISFYPAFSQTIPLGTPLLDEYLRRAQLLGKVDSTSSWMIRPLYPTEAFGVKDGFDLDSSIVDFDQSRTHKRFGPEEKGKFLLLPASYRMQYNSTYAFGTNDGAFIPNRGLQHLLSIGTYLEYEGLSLQFQPELLLAQNKDYIGFPIEH
nr:hypothetical protein [Algoriphagus sp.]